MANTLDTEAGTELFSSYEAEYNLVQADLTQKLDQVAELSGEARKAALNQATRALEEATELFDQMRLEKSNIPSAARLKVNARFRNHQTDLDAAKRKLAQYTSAQAALFGARYSDNPAGPDDIQREQRQQLLSGTDSLNRSSQRLRDSQRLAEDTERIGAGAYEDLVRQREVISNTQRTLEESEGYVNRSVNTLRGMARRMATNRLITIAIITVLVLLIIAVIVSKFR